MSVRALALPILAALLAVGMVVVNPASAAARFDGEVEAELLEHPGGRRVLLGHRGQRPGHRVVAVSLGDLGVAIGTLLERDAAAAHTKLTRSPRRMARRCSCR